METITFSLKEFMAFVGLLACLLPLALFFVVTLNADLADSVAELGRWLWRQL